MNPREALVAETREWLERALAEDAAAHLTGIERLSQYAWRFRYPGAPYSPERPEAEDARHAAGRLLDAVATRLESQFGD